MATGWNNFENLPISFPNGPFYATIKYGTWSYSPPFQSMWYGDGTEFIPYNFDGSPKRSEQFTATLTLWGY